MKKNIFLILIIVLCLCIFTGCDETTKNNDKGLIQNESISFIDKYNGKEYSGIKVEKTYGYVSSTGRTQRLIFIKNTTNSNLYMYVTSQMLDNSGNSVETVNERIDVIGANSSYIITEDYYNNYKDFNTIVEISEPPSKPCLDCISVVEQINDDGDISITYKNISNDDVGGKIKLIAYKDGKITDWTSISLGNLEVGESETYETYLTEYDKYEVFTYANK